MTESKLHIDQRYLLNERVLHSTSALSTEEQYNYQYKFIL